MLRLPGPINRIVAVLVREIREFSRSPLLIVLSIAAPLLIFLLFSYGFSMDVKDIPFSFIDYSKSPESRAYIDTFTASGYFSLYAERQTADEVWNDSQLDRIRVAIVIPEDFARKLHRQQPAQVQFLINGTNAQRASVVKGYSEGVNAEYNRRLLERFVSRKYGKTTLSLEPVSIKTTAWFNPSMDSKNFLVPGIIAFVLFSFPAMMTAIALSREKESGMIFNVYTSPISKLQYLIGKTLLYVFLMMVNYCMLFLLAVQLYDVPFNGNFLLLLFLTFLFITASSGIGLFVAVLVRTQVAALLISVVSTFLPGFLYSGLMMPIEGMGPDAQYTAAMLPISYFMKMIRIVFLKGTGLQHMIPEVLGLSTIILVLYTLSWVFFKKRIA